MWEALFIAVASTAVVVLLYLIDSLRSRHWPGVLFAGVGIVWGVAIASLLAAKMGW